MGPGPPPDQVGGRRGRQHLAEANFSNHLNPMPFARTAFWRPEDDDGSAMSRSFWRKLRRVAASIPFAEDLLAAYYCAFDRDTPLPVKATLVGAIAYFVLPFDAIPDVLPVLGFDPATLYEAAGLRGMVDPSIRPAWRGARICGVAATVECPPGDNLMLHHAVAAAKPGEVIVARTGGYLLTGAWGEILTVAAQVRGVTGLAIDGAVQDIEAIAEHGFPIFSRGLAIGAATKQRPG